VLGPVGQEGQLPGPGLAHAGPPRGAGRRGAAPPPAAGLGRGPDPAGAPACRRPSPAGPTGRSPWTRWIASKRLAPALGRCWPTPSTGPGGGRPADVVRAGSHLGGGPRAHPDGLPGGCRNRASPGAGGRPATQASSLFSSQPKGAGGHRRLAGRKLANLVMAARPQGGSSGRLRRPPGPGRRGPGDRAQPAPAGRGGLAGVRAPGQRRAQVHPEHRARGRRTRGTGGADQGWLGSASRCTRR